MVEYANHPSFLPPGMPAVASIGYACSQTSMPFDALVQGVHAL